MSSSYPDSKAVAEIMGLSSPAMLYRHYQHVMTKQQDQALESVPAINLGHTAGHTESVFVGIFVGMSKEK